MSDLSAILQRLTKREAATLKAWDGVPEEHCLPFKAVARRSGQPLEGIRRTVRALARKGTVRYERGLWTDEGEPAGSGYGVTPLGQMTLATSALALAQKEEKDV